MIDIQSTQDLLFLRESEEFEFKAAEGKDHQGELPNNFWETYSAMANTNGGYVFFLVLQKEKNSLVSPTFSQQNVYGKPSLTLQTTPKKQASTFLLMHHFWI